MDADDADKKDEPVKEKEHADEELQEEPIKKAEYCPTGDIKKHKEQDEQHKEQDE